MDLVFILKKRDEFVSEYCISSTLPHNLQSHPNNLHNQHFKYIEAFAIKKLMIQHPKFLTSENKTTIRWRSIPNPFNSSRRISILLPPTQQIPFYTRKYFYLQVFFHQLSQKTRVVQESSSSCQPCHYRQISKSNQHSQLPFQLDCQLHVRFLQLQKESSFKTKTVQKLSQI